MNEIMLGWMDGWIDIWIDGLKKSKKWMITFIDK